MSKVKFAPWLAVTEKYCDSASVVDSSGAELASVGYLLSKSKRPPETSREIDKDETDAIVRLFAAAPDLLAVVQVLLATRNVDAQWFHDAKLAVAKAEGRNV